jgi:hypothetical protein
MNEMNTLIDRVMKRAQGIRSPTLAVMQQSPQVLGDVVAQAAAAERLAMALQVVVDAIRTCVAGSFDEQLSRCLAEATRAGNTICREKAVS